MIFRDTQSGRGVHVILSRLEASQLGAIVASGKGMERESAALRVLFLEAVGRVLYPADIGRGWWLRLPLASENAGLDIGQMGIVKLVEQARANPAIRKAAQGVLEEAARKIGRLIDQAGPRDATAAQSQHVVGLR